MISDFNDILVSAMLDAATDGKCTVLQTTITPAGERQRLVRLIVIPEELDFVRASPTEKFARPA